MWHPLPSAGFGRSTTIGKLPASESGMWHLLLSAGFERITTIAMLLLSSRFLHVVWLSQFQQLYSTVYRPSLPTWKESYLVLLF